MEKCIGCELCAGVCPVNCIYVRGLDNPPDHPVSPGERYGYIYEINYLRCIHCDLCVEACPTQAITESKMFEFSFTNRADANLHEGRTARRRPGLPAATAVGRLARRRSRDDRWLDARPRRPTETPPTKASCSGPADLGAGVRAAEAGQTGVRDDAATGSKQIRNMFPKHLESEDVPLDQLGLAGMMNTMRAKMPKRRPRKEKA